MSNYFDSMMIRNIFHFNHVILYMTPFLNPQGCAATEAFHSKKSREALSWLPRNSEILSIY